MLSTVATLKHCQIERIHTKGIRLLDVVVTVLCILICFQTFREDYDTIGVLPRVACRSPIEALHKLSGKAEPKGKVKGCS